MANKEKLLDLKGKLVVATIFIALFCSFPYTFPRFFPIPELTIIMALELLVLFILYGTLKTRNPLPGSLTVICLVQITIFLLLFIYHGDLFYLMRFALLVVITHFSLYVVNNSIGITNFITVNNIWLVIQVVLAALGFVLIISNIISPLLVYNFDSGGVDYFYGITTTNAIIGNIPRMAGYFDEPGALAQWGVYALVLNKISPRYSKKIELLLIFGLFFTFSMAFFIQLALYLVLFNISRLKRFIPVLIVLVGGFFLAQKYIPEDTDLYILTFKRLETTGGQLETNRDDAKDLAKSYYQDNPIMGKGYTNLVKSGAYVYDNPYETLATSGLVGTFALYLPLLVILFKYRKRGAWQAVAILAAGYLQRPFHIQYIHYLMMYLLFIQCYFMNKPRETGAIVNSISEG